MKKTVTRHLLIRCISLTIFISSFIVFFFGGYPHSRDSALILLLSADIVLQLYPLPSQGPGSSMAWVAGYCLLIVALAIFHTGFQLVCGACCAYLVVYQLFRCRQRFSRARNLFCQNNVMVLLRDYSHLFYTTLIFLTVLTPVCLWMPLLSVIYCCLYYRAYSTRTFFVSATFEREVFEIARGEIRNVSTGITLSDSRMEAMYARIVDYMDKEKPFLDQAYSIYDLAHHTGTNKTYVSRVVNMYSGRNFCQFVNWYRVRYAVSFAKENPKVRVTELALRAGFNSAVSFNAAFKVFMGLSPGEYLQQIMPQE